MNKFQDLLWQLVVIVVIGCALFVAGNFIFHDHAPTSYYVGEQGYSANNATLTCVYANNIWYVDERVFCSTEKEEATKFATILNDKLKESKSATK